MRSLSRRPSPVFFYLFFFFFVLKLIPFAFTATHHQLVSSLREILRFIRHPLGSLFEQTQPLAALVERLARLLHFGCYGSSFGVKRFQVRSSARDVTGNTPNSFSSRRFTNCKWCERYWNCVNCCCKGRIISYRVPRDPKNAPRPQRDLGRILPWALRAFHRAERVLQLSQLK